MTDLNELFTIRDFLRYAVSYFNKANLYYGHGTDNAWDEAVLLVLHALHLPAEMTPTILDARLTLSERQKIMDLIEKRITHRIPAPYLINEAWFAKLPFYVDASVLIPRSSIAELIENHFEPWLKADSAPTILDLCTGSGCIAIACAKHLLTREIDASDISTEALAIAEKNILRHQVADKVHLYRSDLFNDLPSKKYDLIVTNPPYVDENDMKTLPAEFRHEPALGLRGGRDGLDIVKRILADAANFLNNDGILIMEVGNSEHALTDLFPTVPFVWLEFEHGDGGVFLITKYDLLKNFT